MSGAGQDRPAGPRRRRDDGSAGPGAVIDAVTTAQFKPRRDAISPKRDCHNLCGGLMAINLSQRR
jgi:hypothetical protein